VQVHAGGDLDKRHRPEVFVEAQVVEGAGDVAPGLAAVGGGEDVGLVHGVGAVPVGGGEGDGRDHDGGINFGEVVEAARVALAHVDVLAAGRVEDIRVRGAAGVRGVAGVHAAVGQGADEAIPIAAVREGVGQHAVVTQVEGIADQ